MLLRRAFSASCLFGDRLPRPPPQPAVFDTCGERRLQPDLRTQVQRCESMWRQGEGARVRQLERGHDHPATTAPLPRNAPAGRAGAPGSGLRRHNASDAYHSMFEEGVRRTSRSLSTTDPPPAAPSADPPLTTRIIHSTSATPPGSRSVGLLSRGLPPSFLSGLRRTRAPSPRRCRGYGGQVPRSTLRDPCRGRATDGLRSIWT
jgi:hypothetical protein